MTQPNDSKTKDLGEIEGDIEQSRREISKDLSAIGEKFSAENVKHETRELVDEAKEAVVDKLREVKANALESVNESLHEVGASARRAGEAGYGYASANAIPLAMIGLGIGWLAMASRSRRRRSEAGFMGDVERRGTQRLDYERGYAAQGGEWDESSGERKQGSVGSAVEGTLERAGELSNRAGRRVGKGFESARKRGRELGHRARDGFVRAEHTAVDFGRENPLAIGAVALAAGVGVGLLLPSTQREDELLGATRDRMLSEVSGSVEGLKRTAAGTAHDVSDAFREVTRG
jgi:ElaB/YqjD/DUF883 family membrane-anchored ribosome-binding protein